jgi:hypothetical protein
MWNYWMLMLYSVPFVVMGLSATTKALKTQAQAQTQQTSSSSASTGLQVLSLVVQHYRLFFVWFGMYSLLLQLQVQ